MSESVSLPGSTRLLGAETPPDFLNDDNQSVASSVNSAARNLLGQLNLPQENAAAPLPQTAPQGPQAANPISVPFGPMPGTLLIRRVERLELGYIEIDGSVYEVLYHSGHPVSDENKTPARKEEILNNAKIMASHLQNSGNFNTLSVNTNGKVLINNDEATSQTTSLTQKDIDTYQGAAGISPETTFKTFAVATACIFNREETSLAHSPYTAADQIDARYQRSLPQQPPRRPGVMPYTAPPQPNPQPSNRPEPAPSPAESTDGDQDTASISGLSHRSENDNRSQRSAPASISPSSQSDLSDSIFEQRSQRGDSESRTIDNSPRSSRHSSAQDHDDDFVSLNSNSWTGVGLHPADDNIEEVPSRADALFHDNSRQTPRQPAAASPLSPRSASPESIQENPLLNATNSDLFKALLKHRFTNDLDLVLTYESIQVNATALIDSIKEKLPRATLRGEQGELNELLGQLTEFLSISKTDFEDYLRILKRDGIRKEIINRDTELTVGNLIMIINARHDDDHR